MKVKIGSRVINCPQPYVIVKDPVKVNQPPGEGYKRKAETVLVSSGRGGNVQVGVEWSFPALFYFSNSISYCAAWISEL